MCSIYCSAEDIPEEEQEIPIMVTNFVLQIPNIVIIPSIEELQHYFGKVITNVLETHKKVISWGQRYSPTNLQTKPPDKLGNYAKINKK